MAKEPNNQLVCKVCEKDVDIYKSNGMYFFCSDKCYFKYRKGLGYATR